MNTEGFMLLVLNYIQVQTINATSYLEGVKIVSKLGL